MKNDNNKIALVTGGSGGIGSACCLELGKAGFQIAIHYNSSELSAKKLSEQIKGSFIVKADLTNQKEIDSIYNLLKERGGIHTLVNNAGMTSDGPIIRSSIEDFDRVVSTNMKSCWYLTKRLSRMMMKKKEGRIINISSVIGSTGNVGQTIYGMTKAAIDNFTKSLSMELAYYNILVNSVAPGFIETPMTEYLPEDVKNKIMEKIPLQKLGTPSDVAKMVRFLAAEGDYCTGNIFHVNGGMYGG